jgi:hypothetical protein
VHTALVVDVSSAGLTAMYVVRNPEKLARLSSFVVPR